MDMTDEQLRQEIRSQSVNGKVTCRAMLELARRVDVPTKTIGELCNEMELRIAACQLGCFK